MSELTNKELIKFIGQYPELWNLLVRVSTQGMLPEEGMSFGVEIIKEVESLVWDRLCNNCEFNRLKDEDDIHGETICWKTGCTRKFENCPLLKEIRYE